MVRKEPTYLTSRATEFIAPINFSDTFSTTNHRDSLEEIAKLTFNTAPKWIQALFAIRNTLGGWIGLKTAPPSDPAPNFNIDGSIGFFKIYDIQEKELVLGTNDSHLNFRAIIYNTDAPTYNIKVTTLVKFNNIWGKIYMTLIKPFHTLVVKGMVKQAFKA